MHMTPSILMFLETEEAEQIYELYHADKYIYLEQLFDSVFYLICSSFLDVSTELIFLNE